MKKILALMLACTMIVSSTVCAFAGDSTGSKSPSAEELLKQIKELEETVKAKEKELSDKADEITEQSDKISNLNDTISEQNDKISNLNDTISEQNDKISDQNDKINAQNDKIDEQNEIIDAQNEKINKQSTEIADQNKQIEKLINSVRSSSARPTSSGSSSGASSNKNNSVSYGSNTIAQGGHVEINGGKSNITFLIAAADSGVSASAASLAKNLGGTLLNVINVSSPVAFTSAKVNFYITGVTVGDNIAVYQIQSGKWVQLQTAEIRQNHVVVNMSQVGPCAFVRVPVLATATH